MRLLGLLSIVAVRLLEVESVARAKPALPAVRLVDAQLLKFVSQLSHLESASMAVHQFWREVAGYGGLLGRKGGGEPGRQTLWRGWQYLDPRFEGYLLGKRYG
jgi:hypothetical protein